MTLSRPQFLRTLIGAVTAVFTLRKACGAPQAIPAPFKPLAAGMFLIPWRDYNAFGELLDEGWNFTQLEKMKDGWGLSDYRNFPTKDAAEKWLNETHRMTLHSR